MTGPAPGRRVLVDADLHLSVDGVDATLVGRGNALTLRTDEPARLTSAFRRSGLIATLRQRERGVAAGRLERSTLTIEGPRGRIARIAPDVRGLPLRAWPAGTRLQVNRPFDLVPAAVGWAVVGTGLAVAWAIIGPVDADDERPGRSDPSGERRRRRAWFDEARPNRLPGA